MMELEGGQQRAEDESSDRSQDELAASIPCNRETDCGEPKKAQRAQGECYHVLYHQCLLRCSQLEAQLTQFRSLAGKLDRLQALQEVVVGGVASNVSLLDKQLQIERLYWQHKVGSMQGKLRAVEKENCKMRKATEKLSTDYCHLLANYVVGRAARTQTYTNLKKTEANKVAEMRQLEVSANQTAWSLKHLQHEYKEAVEFSDAERQILQEAHTELESELSNTREALKAKNIQSASLQGQVASLTKDVEDLSQYTQQYQEKVTHKITVLKNNEQKTENEIIELDQLIERVRMVLHANLDHVKMCPPLLEMLIELDGEESTITSTMSN